MWPALVFIAVALAVFAVQRSAALNDTDDLLETSFAAQRPVVHGKEMPASKLHVVHRWRSHVVRGNPGGVMEIDANWLCRTDAGLYVVAIAVGEGDYLNASFSRPKVEIRWLWRSISEERARQLLAATPDAYREVFGTAPGVPGRPAG
ncbi:hypothetical protein ABZR86_17930 [Dyella marensis]|uniref:Uncharacterized protein n=1 Tax=Dyella marensis TaxID=500610 RepID=A0A1I2J2Z6_9GAMM|nr:MULTISPECIES: hypothetical protein [Dyella]SFF48380.1 hypothetical protein SAMN02799615_03794 [Dyella marensis]